MPEQEFLWVYNLPLYIIVESLPYDSPIDEFPLTIKTISGKNKLLLWTDEPAAEIFIRENSVLNVEICPISDVEKLIIFSSAILRMGIEYLIPDPLSFDFTTYRQVSIKRLLDGGPMTEKKFRDLHAGYE